MAVILSNERFEHKKFEQVHEELKDMRALR